MINKTFKEEVFLINHSKDSLKSINQRHMHPSESLALTWKSEDDFIPYANDIVDRRQEQPLSRRWKYFTHVYLNSKLNDYKFLRIFPARLRNTC